jgi:hypothetical protein
MAGSCFERETEMAIKRGGVGVDRGHPQWPNLSPFFLFTGKVAGGRRWVAGSGQGRWSFIWFLDWVFCSHF